MPEPIPKKESMISISHLSFGHSVKLPPKAGTIVCPHCERLCDYGNLRIHFTGEEAIQVNVLRCPHCETISIIKVKPLRGIRGNWGKHVKKIRAEVTVL